MNAIVHDIVEESYRINPTPLDATLMSLGLSGWLQTLNGLTFQGWDTGGGCMMLIAELPGTDGHQVGITDGEADFPRNSEDFWVGIMDPDGDELFYMFVKQGRLENGSA
ncbi:hypothetical protein [Deinococcus alpinitundrae]|uniref:hypothetical protein n=1 Tax=Deinococcus alpinitundrae TaxID=468913 RepID=UPI00137B5C3D|nr:hypothetical protein [Deinococcus alpinitundrae]